MAQADWSTAAQIASAVREGSTSAQSVVRTALASIEARNLALNAFTAITSERALAKARAIDAARMAGTRLGPLAGVPFAVKNLFDVTGLTTVAGSKINRDRPAATRDSPLITRLEAAGAVLVGALNMGEYAYDFTGENLHDGAARNPHDIDRMTGGSSSGSGGAVAGGMVPIALGSDTNGSIRVPASFCGIFGLKPTYGRLPRNDTFPFVASLDHLGPLARSVQDLVLAFDAMQGFDASDPVCVDRPIAPVLPTINGGIDGLRIAVTDGYFKEGASPQALLAVAAVAGALGPTTAIELPEARRARSAAFVITASEASALHLDRLRHRAADYDPAVRDRLLAGAMVPASLVIKAQMFRRWYRREMLRLFETVDAIIAPATPMTAPRIGEATMTLNGSEVPLRPNIGIYTQPISFIGLPVVAVPVPLSPMPIGVQIIAAPWREDIALRIARVLEERGVVLAPQTAELMEGFGHMDINIPDVVSEVRAAFDLYERAIGSNDVATLTAQFRDGDQTIRYGIAENLYGSEEIAAFRSARSPVGLERTLARTQITSYGRDTAIASTLFYRTSIGPGKVGRQMQTWVRFDDGWFIVAAHVSVIDEPPAKA